MGNFNKKRKREKLAKKLKDSTQNTDKKETTESKVIKTDNSLLEVVNKKVFLEDGRQLLK